MPKKYVLKRKYKEYLDPLAQEWYNAVYTTTDFEKDNVNLARYFGGNKAAERERIKLKQEVLNTADDIEKTYRTRAKRYIQNRLEQESNPNFVGPTIPLSIKTIPETVKESIGGKNRALGDHPLDYDPLHTIMRIREAHWPEKGWQEGATITYPNDTLNNVYPTNKDPKFVHYRLGGIHIKPENRGKFTAWAEKHDMGVQEAANHILANKDNYSSTLVKRANFAKNFGGRKKADLGTQYPLIGGVQPFNFTVPTFTPEPSRFSNFLGNFGLNTSDLAATGVQILGNIGSSLINNAAINRLRFTPIHTRTVAESPVKFNTTYDINPQLDNVRESLGSIQREAINNSASSRTAFGRIANSRLRGIGAYNELYGQKLNQETAMLNADAQNRQGVRTRNANRLQQNIARDTIYNAQGEDNLNNIKATLKGQNWSNFVQQLSGSLIGTYNRGQQRISDANSLAYLYASNPNAARLFMNNNSLIRRIFGTARGFQGINI